MHTCTTEFTSLMQSTMSWTISVVLKTSKGNSSASCFSWVVDGSGSMARSTNSSSSLSLDPPPSGSSSSSSKISSSSSIMEKKREVNASYYRYIDINIRISVRRERGLNNSRVVVKACGSGSKLLSAAYIN